MHSDPPSALLNRVRKLLAKAEAEGVTPPEAEALTAKAAELMARYGIDRARLAATRPDTDRPGSRIIDIDNERHPKVISRIRLAVHNPDKRATDQQNDPGANSGTQGYAAHYCAVPRLQDPGILACSMILSGLVHRQGTPETAAGASISR